MSPVKYSNLPGLLSQLKDPPYEWAINKSAFLLPLQKDLNGVPSVVGILSVHFLSFSQPCFHTQLEADLSIENLKA
jgi:hypothetical protein